MDLVVSNHANLFPHSWVGLTSNKGAHCTPVRAWAGPCYPGAARENLLLVFPELFSVWPLLRLRGHLSFQPLCPTSSPGLLSVVRSPRVSLLQGLRGDPGHQMIHTRGPELVHIRALQVTPPFCGEGPRVTGSRVWDVGLPQAGFRVRMRLVCSYPVCCQPAFSPTAPHPPARHRGGFPSTICCPLRTASGLHGGGPVRRGKDVGLSHRLILQMGRPRLPPAVRAVTRGGQVGFPRALWAAVA